MIFQKTDNKNNNLKKRIAYILGTYPDLTTTFIDREILEVKKTGINLVLIAVRKSSPFKMSPDIKNLSKEIKYLLPVPWIKFILTNFYWSFSKPFIYFTTLFYIFTRDYKSNISRMKSLLHFGEGIRALQLLKNRNIDHIHAHFADRAAVISMVVSKFLKIPYSLSTHASDIYVSPVLLEEKIKNAKFVTTCTAYNKKYLENLTGCKINLIYHGVNISGVRKSHFTFNDDCQIKLILSVGQLKEKKGFLYLIKACHLLKEQGENFVCEIIGEGPERYNLEKLIKELRLKKNVILRGALPNNKVMERYKDTNIFVLPCVIAKNSDRDGIPNVLLEAMLNKIPVISTRLSGIPEVIKDGFNGLLVDSKCSSDFAQKISILLKDNKLYNKLAENGRKTIEQKFNIENNVRKLIELF